MKIVTWNINGIRAVATRTQSIGQLSSLKTELDAFDADVICLQETKITREMIDETVAVVDGYESAFSFCRVRSGYSGVATFFRTGAHPVAVEDGFTGLLQPEAITAPSTSAGCKDAWNQVGGGIGAFPAWDRYSSDELMALDSEGRCLVSDHGAFVLFNVYFPNAYPGSDDPVEQDRFTFKMDYSRALQERVDALRESGREVVVVGDFNVSHTEADHCDPAEVLRHVGTNDWYSHPARRWFSSLLHKEGSNLVDTFRLHHPTRKKAFTCWNTKTSARLTNYGTRIDYILVSSELAKASSWSDLLNDWQGSDHCPVYTTFTDVTVATPDMDSLPRTCTRFMQDFTAKQTRMTGFLMKRKEPEPGEEPHDRRAAPAPDGTSFRPAPLAQGLQHSKGSSGGFSHEGKRRKGADTSGEPQRQRSLLNFFKPHTSRAEEHPNGGAAAAGGGDGRDGVPLGGRADEKAHPAVSEQRGAAGVSEGQMFVWEKLESRSDHEKLESHESQEKVVKSWKSLLGGRAPAPLCRGHSEPCVFRTVKKEGPNLGRSFYVCARPQGSKEDKTARCNHFEWTHK